MLKIGLARHCARSIFHSILETKFACFILVHPFMYSQRTKANALTCSPCFTSSGS